MIKRITALVGLCIMLVACSKVPVTGRKQFTLFPESQMIGMSLTAYDDFLKENPAASGGANGPKAQMVSRVGQRMAASVEAYLKSKGNESLVKDFQWEFNLVDDPAVNAWCMPGGKVVVYTGIMDVTQTEAGLAVVMGHEIAHAVARHGNERMSQGMAAQLGGTAASVWLNQNPKASNDLLLQAVGMGSQLGMLSFSRKHESEADEMGLIFMAIAGYDPREAPQFWQRMSSQSGGQPPEFLSTHPSHDRRVKDLQANMPEALKYYKK